MKKYVKAKVVAKNNPQGSYAAGCPPQDSQGGGSSGGTRNCKKCERAA